MFSPNCVIVVPFPEIAIKGSKVRAFMEKRLRRNIILYLKHFNAEYSGLVSLAGRIIIYSNEPNKVVGVLKDCFGIYNMYLGEEVKDSSLNNLCKMVVEVSKNSFSDGTFAVRGKSFSKEFSSKKLEEELGGALLDAFPKLRVKLKFPEKEVCCLAYNNKAFFYFAGEKCAGGMPVGTQGTTALIISKDSKPKDLSLIAENLLRSGCQVLFVGEKIPLELSSLEKFNCFKPLKHSSIQEAKEYYASGDLRAFFSSARTTQIANKDSELVGVKVFASLLF
jgi:hypothetical protein